MKKILGSEGPAFKLQLPLSMDIRCKHCGASVATENIYLEKTLAKCNNCQTVFDFSDQILLPKPKRKVPETPPKGISIYAEMDGMTIERKWFSPIAIFLAIFCALWDSFMIVWFSISISQQQWMMAAFGSIHALVGIGITYAMLANFLNKSLLKISPSLLSIKHTPLPWKGNRQLSVMDIKQLYCRECVTRSKNSVQYHYELRAQLKNNQDIKLLSGLTNSDQALYIESEIEKILGIEDVHIDGEYQPSKNK